VEVELKNFKNFQAVPGYFSC